MSPYDTRTASQGGAAVSSAADTSPHEPRIFGARSSREVDGGSSSSSEVADKVRAPGVFAAAGEAAAASGVKQEESGLRAGAREAGGSSVVSSIDRGQDGLERRGVETLSAGEGAGDVSGLRGATAAATSGLPLGGILADVGGVEGAEQEGGEDAAAATELKRPQAEGHASSNAASASAQRKSCDLEDGEIGSPRSPDGLADASAIGSAGGGEGLWVRSPAWRTSAALPSTAQRFHHRLNHPYDAGSSNAREAGYDRVKGETSRRRSSSSSPLPLSLSSSPRRLSSSGKWRGRGRSADRSEHHRQRQGSGGEAVDSQARRKSDSEGETIDGRGNRDLHDQIEQHDASWRNRTAPSFRKRFEDGSGDKQDKDIVEWSCRRRGGEKIGAAPAYDQRDPTRTGEYGDRSLNHSSYGSVDRDRKRPPGDRDRRRSGEGRDGRSSRPESRRDSRANKAIRRDGSAAWDDRRRCSPGRRGARSRERVDCGTKEPGWDHRRRSIRNFHRTDTEASGRGEDASRRSTERRAGWDRDSSGGNKNRRDTGRSGYSRSTEYAPRDDRGRDEIERDSGRKRVSERARSPRRGDFTREASPGIFVSKKRGRASHSPTRNHDRGMSRDGRGKERDRSEEPWKGGQRRCSRSRDSEGDDGRVGSGGGGGGGAARDYSCKRARLDGDGDDSLRRGIGGGVNAIAYGGDLRWQRDRARDRRGLAPEDNQASTAAAGAAAYAGEEQRKRRPLSLGGGKLHDRVRSPSTQSRARLRESTQCDGSSSSSSNKNNSSSVSYGSRGDIFRISRGSRRYAGQSTPSPSSLRRGGQRPHARAARPSGRADEDAFLSSSDESSFSSWSSSSSKGRVHRAQDHRAQQRDRSRDRYRRRRSSAALPPTAHEWILPGRRSRSTSREWFQHPPNSRERAPAALPSRGVRGFRRDYPGGGVVRPGTRRLQDESPRDSDGPDMQLPSHLLGQKPDFKAEGGGMAEGLKFASDREEDARRMVQRQKQIDFGKNTRGYDEYLQAVPKHKRRPTDPRTPDKEEKMSKRRWAGKIRGWRRQLHAYDNIAAAERLTPDPDKDDSEEPGAVSTKELLGGARSDTESNPSRSLDARHYPDCHAQGRSTRDADDLSPPRQPLPDEENAYGAGNPGAFVGAEINAGIYTDEDDDGFGADAAENAGGFGSSDFPEALTPSSPGAICSVADLGDNRPVVDGNVSAVEGVGGGREDGENCDGAGLNLGVRKRKAGERLETSDDLSARDGPGQDDASSKRLRTTAAARLCKPLTRSLSIEASPRGTQKKIFPADGGVHDRAIEGEGGDQRRAGAGPVGLSAHDSRLLHQDIPTTTRQLESARASESLREIANCFPGSSSGGGGGGDQGAREFHCPATTQEPGADSVNVERAPRPDELLLSDRAGGVTFEGGGSLAWGPREAGGSGDDGRSLPRVGEKRGLCLEQREMAVALDESQLSEAEDDPFSDDDLL